MRQPFVRQYEDPLAEEDPLDLRRFKPVPVPAGTAPQNTVNGIPKLDLGGIDVPDDAGSSDSYGPLDAATDPMAAAAGYGIDLSQAPAAAAPPTAPGPTPTASDYWRQQASTLKQQQIDQGTVRPSGWRSALALLSSMALGHRNPQAAKAATDWIVGSDPNVKAAGKLSSDADIAEQMAQQERQQDYQNTLAGVRTQMARTNALKASELDQNRQQAEKDRTLQRDTARSEWIQQHGGAPIDDLAPVPPPPGEAPPVNVQSPTVAQYATEGTTAAPNVTGGQGGVSPAIAGAMAANAPKMGDTIKGATRTVDPLSGQKVLIPSIEDFNAQQAKAKAAAMQITPEIAESLGHPEIAGMNDRQAALAIRNANAPTLLSQDQYNSQIDAIADPTKEATKAYNAAAKTLVGSAIQRKDPKSAQAEIDKLRDAVYGQNKSQFTINANLASGNSLDQNGEAIAQSIAQYRQAPITGFSMSKPQNRAIMARVAEINPDYRAQNYATFQKTENDATTGKIATSANALNTMMGHLAVLDNAADALKNNNVQVLNRLANFVGVQAGQSPVTTYNTIVHRLGPEVTKAYLASGGSLGERGTNEEDFSPNLGPDQIKQNIGVSALLADSKIKALQDQYQRGTYGMGKQQLITPEAEQARQRLAGRAANLAGKTATTAHVADYAKQKGISVDAATQEFKKSGYSIQ